MFLRALFMITLLVLISARSPDVEKPFMKTVFPHLQELRISDVMMTPKTDYHPSVSFQHIEIEFADIITERDYNRETIGSTITYTFSGMYTIGIEQGLYYPVFEPNIVFAYFINTGNGSITFFFNRSVDIHDRVDRNVLIIAVMEHH